MLYGKEKFIYFDFKFLIMNFYSRITVLSFTLLFSYGISGAQPVDQTIDSLINLITTDSYRSHFKHIRTDSTSFKELTNTLAQSNDHDACRDYVFKAFSTYFGEKNVSRHDFTVEDYSGLSNVIAYKEGIYPWKGIIVISAHYDACNNRDLSDTLKIAPGANDNGTGLAAMLEVARIISKFPTERSVLFTAWDAEEFMYNGYPTGSNEWYSEYVTLNKPTDWINIGKGGKINKKDFFANINFDMIGNPHDSVNGKPLLWICTGNPSHKKFAVDYINTFNTYIPEISLKNKGVMIYSDHYTFASRRIPALMNLESDYEKDPFFHTVYDYFDNPYNIDFDFAVNVARGGFAFILKNAGIMIDDSAKKDLTGEGISVKEGTENYSIESDIKPDSIKVYDFTGKKIDVIADGNQIILSPQKKGGFFVYMFYQAKYSVKKVFLEGKKKSKTARKKDIH
jgi:hypothetical protein